MRTRFASRTAITSAVSTSNDPPPPLPPAPPPLELVVAVDPDPDVLAGGGAVVSVTCAVPERVGSAFEIAVIVTFGGDGSDVGAV